MNHNVQLEDRELEDFILEEGDTAVPLEIYRGEQADQYDILVYPCCLPTVLPILESGADLFDRAVLESLARNLDPLLDSFSFVPSPDGICQIFEFKIDSPSDVPASLILPDTAIFLPTEDSEEESVSACHIADGKQVAEAAPNDYSDDDSVEIHVQCLPEYRGKGYASSCVAKLAEYYTKNGNSVRYLCRVQNKASLRIAEKCGFTLQGKRVSFVYYRRGSL